MTKSQENRTSGLLHKTASGATYPPSLAHLNIAPSSLLPTIPPTIALAIGAFVFKRQESPPKVLLVRRSPSEPTFPGLWETPGGGVEDRETVLDAVVREVKEETGLVVSAIRGFHGFVEFHGKRSRELWRKYQFEVEVEEGEVVVDPVEHNEYMWAVQEEVAGLATTTEEHRRVIMEGFVRRKAAMAVPGVDCV